MPSALRLLSLGLLAGIGCDFGGLNQNQENAGNQDDGVNLGFGEIAVAPTGTYFLSRSDDALVHANILTGGAKVLPGVTAPLRLAFDPDGRRIYLTVGSGKEGHVVAYDTEARRELWRRPVGLETASVMGQGSVAYPLLAIADDGRHLFVTERFGLEILDVADGALVRHEGLDRPAIDVDATPDDARVLVTTEHDWLTTPDGDDIPEAHILAVPRDPDPARKPDRIEVPNCSDELVVAPDGEHAFLAPTTCNKDPISIVDLGSGEFVRNLPGFGPVAMSPAGTEIIGFLDLEEVDESLFDDPEQIPDSNDRYHLMFIDAATLGYDFLAVGDQLPRYAMTPDGKVLLVDTTGWFEDLRMRVVDIEARSIAEVEGAPVRLDAFVVTSDSRRVFLLDDGLWDLDVPGHRVEGVSLPFEPTNINITPTDAFLLLREDDRTIRVFDVAAGALVRAVEL
jgi:DNA-binding beta-propeller fold protein YncE